LEKLQAENAQEWAMREKLSSEKLALERENKRMRSEVVRLEDELRERSRPPAAAVDIDMKAVQDELACKTKVFSFMHVSDSLKKNLSVKCDVFYGRQRCLLVNFASTLLLGNWKGIWHVKHLLLSILRGMSMDWKMVLGT